jgi:hypothetical protein
VPGALFVERLRTTPRAWALFAFAVAVAFLAVSPLLVPFVVVAWFVNVARFRRVVVRVYPDRFTVGRKSVPLSCLDLASARQARNPWPWRHLSPRYLGANPVWTDDSLALRGRLDGRAVVVAVGTNRRAELLAALTRAREASRSAGPWGPPVVAPRAGWYADPWMDGVLRWWDGHRWTSYVAGPAPP